MEKRLKVLFLCTGNSCRSQMAEGWTRHLKSDTDRSHISAGIETHGLNPDAVKVMAEAGVDISSYKSKHIADDFGECSPGLRCHGLRACPRNLPCIPGKCRIIHAGFDDPPLMAKKLAESGADKEAQLDVYRRVRDEIRNFVETLPDCLTGKDTITS